MLVEFEKKLFKLFDSQSKTSTDTNSFALMKCLWYLVDESKLP